jgi:hypothetical protein
MSTAKRTALTHFITLAVVVAIGWPTAALAQGSFLHRQPPAQPTPPDQTQPNAPQTPATPAAPAAAPAPSSAPPPQAAPAPAPQPSGPASVVHVHEIPLLDWELAALYSAKEQGFDTLPRPFLSDWLGLTDCAAWHAAEHNEFAMEDQRQALRKILAVRQIPARVRISVKARLGEYDFDRGGYPVPGPQGAVRLTIPVNSACRGFYPGRNQPGMPNSFDLYWNDDPQWAPVLSVSRDRAEQISQKLGSARQVVTDYVVEFVSLGAQRLNNGSPAAILVRPVAMFVWVDEAREQFVGALGDVASGAEIKAAAMPSPPSAEVGPATPTSGAVESYSSDGWPVINGKVMALAGIESIPASMRRGFSSFVAAQGSYLECQPAGQTTYRCLTRKAVDIGQAILVNGAAKTTADAPQAYRDAEQQAQTAKRGVWK